VRRQRDQAHAAARLGTWRSGVPGDGGPRRVPAHPRGQTLPPSRRRRSLLDLWGAYSRRRPRADPGRVHRRTRHPSAECLQLLARWNETLWKPTRASGSVLADARGASQW